MSAPWQADVVVSVFVFKDPAGSSPDPTADRETHRASVVSSGVDQMYEMLGGRS